MSLIQQHPTLSFAICIQYYHSFNSSKPLENHLARHYPLVKAPKRNTVLNSISFITHGQRSALLTGSTHQQPLKVFDHLDVSDGVHCPYYLVAGKRDTVREHMLAAHPCSSSAGSPLIHSMTILLERKLRPKPGQFQKSSSRDRTGFVVQRGF